MRPFNRIIIVGLISVFNIQVHSADVDLTPRIELNDYNAAYGDAPWVESESRIPDLPEDDDLVEVSMDTNLSGMTMYVDPESIYIDADDLTTRMWVVIKNNTGAYNGRYEAYRCATKEYKTYAYANPNRAKKIRESRNPRWKEIGHKGAGAYRREFMRSYVCEHSTPVDVADLKRAIIYKIEK